MEEKIKELENENKKLKIENDYYKSTYENLKSKNKELVKMVNERSNLIELLDEKITYKEYERIQKEN